MSESRPVALVTGGARGIGLGIAKCLAQSGFDLALSGRRPADAAEVQAAVEELRCLLGGEVFYWSADVADTDARRELLEAVQQRFARLEVLVNNAGVAPTVRADLLEADDASFDRLISINLKGPYFLTQAVARWMIEQRQRNAAFHGANH